MKVLTLLIILIINLDAISADSIFHKVNTPNIIFKDIWKNENNLKTIELAKIWLEGFDFENALTDDERNIFKPIIENGIFYDNDKKIIDTTYSYGGKAIFVIFENGDFFIQPKWKIGVFEHADLASGKKVLCAGSVEIINGYLKRISDFSVQYPPIHYYSLTKAINLLKEKEIDFEDVRVQYKRDLRGVLK
jgi:hypothetical protein